MEPPEDVHVSAVNPNQLTVDWSPQESNNYCPVMTYNIATSDCGICPNATTSTSIRCTNLVIDGQTCSIIIQMKACERSFELSSNATLTIVLKGTIIIILQWYNNYKGNNMLFNITVPSAPETTARWMNQFASILTSFNESVRNAMSSYMHYICCQ